MEELARIIYGEGAIISVMPNDPNTGITYTLQQSIVCTEEEAYAFFADYPEVEQQKLRDYFENHIPTENPYDTINL